MSTNLSVLNKTLFGLSLIAASLLMLFWLASPARAATYTVTNTNDSGAGSLRQSIADANNTSGTDTIVFMLPSGADRTITLTSQLPAITDTAGLTIDGGSAHITVSGNETVRVFEVARDAKLFLKSLTVVDGRSISPESSGAGLFNNGGTVRVTSSSFSGNTVSGTNQGGFGGAIFNSSGGTLTLTDSNFSENRATVSGTNQSSFGGAIFNSSGGTLTLTDSNFSGNSANGEGGGIYNDRGTITATDSTFSGNSATSTTSVPRGGVISNGGGKLTVINSTFSGNSVSGASSSGGGIYSGDAFTQTDVPPQVVVINSTFSGNSVSGASSSGGGIFSADHTILDVTNSTFSENNTDSSPGAAIVAGQELPSMTVLRNTIVAAGSTSQGDNCVGSITDDGYNMDDDGSCVDETVTTSKKTTDPMLDPQGLQDNGGPTKTIALQRGSPAIDAIPSGTNGCGTDIATDQRGVARPQDGDADDTTGCDIGAFELQPPPPALSIDDVNVTEDDSGTTNATFTVSLSAPSAQTVTVDYATADGTATAGADYQSTSGTLTFAPRTTSKSITVTVNPDNAAEPEETFFVNLSNATNAAIHDTQGKGTIIDTPPDTTPPTLSVTHTADGSNGWNKTSPVTLNVSASDSGSGLAGAPTCKDGTTALTLMAGTAGNWTVSVSGEGTHPISCTVSDNAGNSKSSTDTVKIDKTPPSVSCSVSPSTLRLPANNHKLVTVTASVQVSDTVSGPDGFVLVSVTSNQSDSGLGRDDVPNDIQGWTPGAPDTSGQLRAERYGKDRIYTLTYQGKDKAGNTKNCQATVRVPKGG